MSLFPAFLKLDGRRCLVVGAGSVARPKIESLLRASAHVIVVAPDAHPDVMRWYGDSAIDLHKREFAVTDLDGIFLVVAATNQKEVNHAVAQSARARGVLCNSVDDPPDCDFYYPSVVERGDLQIAVSTAGKSPALSMQLREELNAMLPADAGLWLDALGEKRRKILAALPQSEERKQILHQLARREICNPNDCPVEQTLDRLLERAPMENDAPTALPGVVYLTGAGPGAPDLLTIRAHSLIRSASCILHDDLVAPEIVSLARPDAFIVNVGKRCGQKQITQEQIHAWMIEYARAGHSVVRLKGGDPALFGRAAEEIAALEAENIPCEIVPGISAPLAAAAAAGISLTDRDRSSRVVFTTRHLAGNQTAGIAATDRGATLALYMPGKDYAALAAELLAHGWPAGARCLVVSAASQPAQQIVRTILADLHGISPLPAPAIILILPSPAS
jgi:uroporphyrin-III C-methyltransferase / precorrin-2 dehydrogenase / sirohydrochlorin ferrochelatase